MVRDDRFKKYQEAGADFLEAAWSRAEELLQELGKVGESTPRQPQGTLDELFESSRRGTEQILAIIQREVAAQLSSIGVSSREDLEELVRRLIGRPAPSKDAGPPGRAATNRAADPWSAAPKDVRTETTSVESATTRPVQKAKKAAPTKKAAGKKATPAKKATAAEKAAPTKKATAAKKATPTKKTGGKKAAGKKTGPAKRAAEGS
jgi:polyhydroxyalkanoate synthesis regulator phasin